MSSKPLSPRQLTAAQMLLTGGTAASVARELGIAERTILRWKKDRQFCREIRRQSGRVTVQVITPPPPRPFAFKFTAAALRNLREVEAMVGCQEMSGNVMHPSIKQNKATAV